MGIHVPHPSYKLILSFAQGESFFNVCVTTLTTQFLVDINELIKYSATTQTSLKLHNIYSELLVYKCLFLHAHILWNNFAQTHHVSFQTSWLYHRLLFSNHSFSEHGTVTPIKAIWGHVWPLTVLTLSHVLRVMRTHPYAIWTVAFLICSLGVYLWALRSHRLLYCLLDWTF